MLLSALSALSSLSPSTAGVAGAAAREGAVEAGAAKNEDVEVSSPSFTGDGIDGTFKLPINAGAVSRRINGTRDVSASRVVPPDLDDHGDCATPPLPPAVSAVPANPPRPALLPLALASLLLSLFERVYKPPGLDDLALRPLHLHCR